MAPRRARPQLRSLHVFPLGLVTFALLALSLPGGASADGGIWKVQRGEALSVIAQRFGVSVEDLRSWNSLTSDRIRVGQELRVEPSAPPGPSAPYRVRRGETLIALARKAETTPAELLRYNTGLDPNRLRLGQEIRIPVTGKRIDYVVHRGESLAQIVERFRVSTKAMRLWNPGLRPRLQAGQTLLIYSEVKPSTSISIGHPHRGKLEEAEPLPAHPGYVIRSRKLAFGTVETIQWMLDGFDALLNAHPDAPKVKIHDMSRARGGYLRGHRSHQSGRDVDIAYYQQRCSQEVCSFRRIQPDDLDTERQWTLLEHWLRGGRVTNIFIDYSLQEPLYEEAKRRGADRSDLIRWFQYPRGDGNPIGVIRHSKSHRDHLHVRFVCDETDPDCR